MKTLHWTSLALLSCSASAGPRPLVTIDSAHDNVHTIDGRYNELAALLRGVGYRARGHDTVDLPERSQVHIMAGLRAPLPDTEVDALVSWVDQGGSLLVAADHPPFATPPNSLVERFGFSVIAGSVADEDENTDFALRPSSHHPIISGIEEVWVYTGAAVAFPPEATILLPLGLSHQLTLRGFTFDPIEPETLAVAAIRRYGDGRVAILSESGMIGCHVNSSDIPYGLCAPEAEENPTFALALVDWLAHL